MNLCLISVIVFFVLLPYSKSQVSFEADFSILTPFDHYWERCVGSGHAVLGLRSDWREALLIAHDRLGFEYVRFHGLFDDDMSVVLNGKYSFYNIDTLFDYIISIGMKPLVELSFTPEEIANGTSTIMHYKGNIEPPKSWDLWYDLVYNLAKHLVSRYGLPEVKTWHFEVYNEPNCGFFAGTKAQYFEMLKQSSKAIKAVDKTLSVGGPATCQSGWIQDTLDYIKANDVELDFISTHEYPTDIKPLKRGILKEVLQNTRNIVGANRPLFYTEFNDGLFKRHDLTYASAFLIKNIPEIEGIVDMLSWWTFSDVFEEGGQDSVVFHEGFGLQTLYNIPKPPFRAFELLHELGKSRVYLNPTNYSTVDAFVGTNQTHVQILVSNHNIPGGDIKTETVKVSVKGVTNVNGESVSAILRRIDDDNANPISKWTEMGKPQYLNNAQIDTLMSASEMKIYNINGTVSDSVVTFQVDVPSEGVASIVFKV